MYLPVNYLFKILLLKTFLMLTEGKSEIPIPRYGNIVRSQHIILKFSLEQINMHFVQNHT